MKKLLLILAVSGSACLAQADTMSFITVLSSAVGSFNKLETADPSSPAYGKTVNFCTQVGNGGEVKLKGTQPAVLGKKDVPGGGMYLSSGTTLGKTDGRKYSLTEIKLKQGGNIKGGRLFGNTFSVGNAASGKADNLYGNELTVAGAKTKTLEIIGASKIDGPGDSTGKEEMVWSNEYQADSACSSGSACAKQYLLKKKGSSSGDWDLHPVDPPTEVEYEYFWEWTNSGDPMLNGNGVSCMGSCLSNAEEHLLDNPKPIPLTRPAGAFSPKCDENQVGKECYGQAVNGIAGRPVEAGTPGATYCTKYKCNRRAK